MTLLEPAANGDVINSSQYLPNMFRNFNNKEILRYINDSHKLGYLYGDLYVHIVAVFPIIRLLAAICFQFCPTLTLCEARIILKFSRLYHFCVRQFMQFSLLRPYSLFFSSCIYFFAFHSVLGMSINMQRNQKSENETKKEIIAKTGVHSHRMNCLTQKLKIWD